MHRRNPPPLPDPLPLDRPLRVVDPHRTQRLLLPGHRVRLTIDHEPLRGVTPEMLLRWFTSIGGTTSYAGRSVPRYRVWHPLDHVSWSLDRPAPGGGAGEGARFHIVEAFGRDPERLVDSVETVERLDRTGIRLVLRRAGVQVFSLEHIWSRGPEGTHYVSVLELGARSRWFRPVNAWLRQRVFTPDMDHAWVRHNVEEVGRLEHLLPALLDEHGSEHVVELTEARPS